jgi:hypothetical protein
MLPRWHIIYGALFTILLYIFAPHLGWFNLLLVFLASFLIDFDHYLVAIRHTKSLSLKKAIKYFDVFMRIEQEEQRRKIYRRGPLMIFHTIEFHILVALLSLVWQPFFYIFIGMVFHSLLDVYDLLRRERMYRREYFFFNWLRNRAS